jgi:hypothetical protein
VLRLSTALRPPKDRVSHYAVAPARSLRRNHRVPSETGVHPTWPVYYLPNRMDDSLTISLSRGKMAALSLVAPSGGYHQDSDQLAVFHIKDDGHKLLWIGQNLSVASHTAAAFYYIASIVSARPEADDA